MALVVGLGNPGPEYAETRHNVGFQVVERLARAWKARRAERRAEYRSWRGAFGGREVTLLEPLTYMNVSGEALIAWREVHRLEPDELLVVVDDVYLPVGEVRVRASGSTGGHRGLESIERALGTREYARLRVGVGSAGEEPLGGHVLAEPAAAEREALEQAVGRAAEAVQCWLRAGVRETMNRFNRRVRKEVSES